MGYIGNQQTEGYSQVPPKQDLTGATGTTLTLSNAVASAEGIDLFINNVRQEPTTAYSVAGTAVTLTGSVVASDDIYVVYNSLALQTSTHPSNQALQATSGVFSGTVSAASATVTGDLTVDTTTLKVDSTNNRVGIGTASPTKKVSASIGLNDTDGYVLEYSGEAKAGMLVIPASGEVRMGAINSTGTYSSTLYANNSEYMRINSTGKIDTKNRDFGFFNHATNVSLADEASIVINATTAGVGILCLYEQASGSNGVFRVGYASCSGLSGQGALGLDTADTDGNVCVFSSGHTITIKNRTGITRGFSIAMFMAGNTFAG